MLPKWKAYDSLPSVEPAYEDDEGPRDGPGPQEKTQQSASHNGGFQKAVAFLSGFFLAMVLAGVVLWTQASAAPSHSHANNIDNSNGAYTPPDPHAFPDLYFSDTDDPPPLLNRSCGATPAEARSAGCVFDLLTTAWTPAACANLDLTREWLDVVTKEGRTWPFYLDKAGSIPQKDLAYLESGEWEGELWSTLRLHQYHCLFIWRKMHVAYLAGDAVDTVMRGLRHSKHCERMMMKNVDLDKVSGVQGVYYRTC